MSSVFLKQQPGRHLLQMRLIPNSPLTFHNKEESLINMLKSVSSGDFGTTVKQHCQEVLRLGQLFQIVQDVLDNGMHARPTVNALVQTYSEKRTANENNIS